MNNRTAQLIGTNHNKQLTCPLLRHAARTGGRIGRLQSVLFDIANLLAHTVKGLVRIRRVHFALLLRKNLETAGNPVQDPLLDKLALAVARDVALNVVFEQFLEENLLATQFVEISACWTDW